MKKSDEQPDAGNEGQVSGVPTEADTGVRPKAFPQLRRIGMATGAVFLYAALIDLAVETFVSGSAFRWWVAGVTLGYLSLLLLLRFTAPTLWARVTTGAKLMVGLFALLGLVVTAAWLPGGFEGGLSGATQPTHRLLSSLTAVAILLAIGLLLSMRRLPAALCVVLVLFGMYGVAGLILGWLKGVSYPALFAGEQFWSVLPWWLQGPAVGVFGVLPATVTLYGAAWIRDTFAGRGERPRFAVERAALLVVVAALAIGLAGLDGAHGSLLTNGTPLLRSARFEPLDNEPLSPEWREMRAPLRSSIDRESLDVDVLQKQLGSDPHALLGFVRDELAFEPYEGALRGARGTLLARAGNAIDRALLLRALLDAAGHETRLAEGALSQDDSEALLRRTLKAGPDAERAGPGIDALFEIAANQLEKIGDALWADGFRAPVAEDPLRSAIEATARHVWVQLKRDNRWVDLDPTPGVSPGEALTSQREIHSDEPDEWHHTLQIRVLVDVDRDGDVVTEEVLVHGTRYADLAGAPIGLFNEREPDRATALLLVGDRVARSRPFPAPPVAGIGGLTPSKEVIEILGDLPTGPGDESTDPEEPDSSELTGQLVRERLLIELDGPSLDAPETVAVTLADREGVDSKRFRDALDVVVGIGTGGPTAAQLPAALVAEGPNPLSPGGIVRLLAALEGTRAALRARVPASAFGLPTRRIVDGPQLTVVRLRLSEDSESVDLEMDLARKSYSLVPAGDSFDRGNTLFFDYVFNGAADHAVERVLLPGGAHSVGALTAAAAEQGIELAVVGSSRGIPEFLPAGAEPAVRDALDRDRVIVLPATPPSGFGAPGAVGWWEVDTDVGWTEDRMVGGGHQESAEYGMLTATRTSSHAAKWRQYGCALAMVLGGVAGEVGTTMTATGDPAGVVLTTFGKVATGIGKMGCRAAPPGPPAPVRSLGRQTASRGFHAIHRTFSRKPWIQGGRVFPGRGRL